MLERDDCLVPGSLDRRILSVVLAGGASSRFGGNKALARLGGVPLIDRVIAKVRAQTTRLVISGNNPQIAGIEIIPDAAPGEGPLTGVLSALRWAGPKGYSAIATFSCDAPFFPDDLVVRLREAANTIAGCSVACCRGLRHPAFAVWPVAVADNVSQAYAQGVRSLRDMQDRIGAIGVEFPPGEGPGGDPFFNINRQADLGAAETWLNEKTCLVQRSRQERSVPACRAMPEIVHRVVADGHRP